MDGKLKEALVSLGFVESVKAGKVPKFKTITKMYHKLALIHHPDRPGGNGDFSRKSVQPTFWLVNIWRSTETRIILMILILKRRLPGRHSITFSLQT